MRIVWLKTELLHPVDKGGKIRTYQMLKALRRDHRITYLTLDDGTGASDARERAVEYCHDVITVPHVTAPKFSGRFYWELTTNLWSPLPYALQKYQSDAMTRALVELTAGSSCDVVVCDFLTPGVNVPPDLKCPLVLFQHNVEAMIWERHYQVATNPGKKAYLYRQWKAMESFERTFSRRADGVITVSMDDKAVMAGRYGVSFVEAVPTGVDTDYFAPMGRVTRDPVNLVFTGSMDWLPNDDAMHFFVEQVLPLVRALVPEVTLSIVGRSPSRWLQDLASRDRSIVVTGRVEDVRPYLAQASAYVVPIRVGGGTRLKIYEGMAMECPMVSTTIGAEGLPLTNGVELVIADTAAAFAEATVRLLRDRAFATDLASRAARRVRTEFAWDGVASRFTELCEAIVASRRPTS